MKQIAAFLVGSCIATSILAGPASILADGETGATLSKIAASASRVTTLACDFSQEKHLKMLNNIHTSKGRLFYKREHKLRWEVEEPTVSGFAVNGSKAIRWKNDDEHIQSFEVRQVPFIKVFSEQVFAWASADFNKLEKRYRIQVVSDEPADLKLFPKSSREKKYLRYIRIVFAVNASHVRLVEIHEPDGDYTRIRFSKMTINGPLPDSLFF